ncbi:MAG: hypothetical protein SOX50_13490 [Terrisporobacter othiniensis]|uniref:hypothetical protein n=1 Tax=Terrisporobacter othiniensis TaxID=1577792 RepID=UPI002A74F3DA|nr:hypothetical protein [Terrisporobacter othiniensis]MDY3374271.1 hypothetical protein [Terrisporobacter othiniensis]
MIYKKDANFPYPLLTNTSNSYDGCNFTLDIELNENTYEYIFQINYDIESDFIKKLIRENKAQLVLVVQSKDNKFFNLSLNETIKTIPKNRISLSKRTTIQLLIQSKEEINFKENNDLNIFYGSIKDQINVPRHSILGFSNSVMFDGSTAKPLELFEKKVDPNLKSEVKVELGSETIIINYKSDELQFIDSPVSSTINNIYVYMGLQKALYRFVNTYGGEDEEVDLEELDLPTDGLDLKLYGLMKSKMIKNVSLENIDEVICSITDRILEKYTSAVRGLYSNGN